MADSDKELNTGRAQRSPARRWSGNEQLRCRVLPPRCREKKKEKENVISRCIMQPHLFLLCSSQNDFVALWAVGFCYIEIVRNMIKQSWMILIFTPCKSKKGLYHLEERWDFPLVFFLSWFTFSISTKNANSFLKFKILKKRFKVHLLIYCKYVPNY